MCIRLGIWLTNKFQVTNIQLSLQIMIFTMNENRFERVSMVRLFLITLLSSLMLLLGMTFMMGYNRKRIV